MAAATEPQVPADDMTRKVASDVVTHNPLVKTAALVYGHLMQGGDVADPEPQEQAVQA